MTTTTYLSPVEVAERFGCSEYYVKEQARKLRWPHIKVGKKRLFTAEHIAEIEQLCEQRPAEDSEPNAFGQSTRSRRAS